jgi:hypothetical protein
VRRNSECHNMKISKWATKHIWATIKDSTVTEILLMTGFLLINVVEHIRLTDILLVVDIFMYSVAESIRTINSTFEWISPYCNIMGSGNSRPPT